MAAPVGGLLWGFGAFCLRVGAQWVLARVQGRHFDAFDRPPPSCHSLVVRADRRPSDEEDRGPVANTKASSIEGRFF